MAQEQQQQQQQQQEQEQEQQEQQQQQQLPFVRKHVTQGGVDKGNGLVATQRIARGSVIWREVPLVTSVPQANSSGSSHCHRCLAAVPESSSSSSSCAEEACHAVYCSAECLSADDASSHRVLCPQAAPGCDAAAAAFGTDMTTRRYDDDGDADDNESSNDAAATTTDNKTPRFPVMARKLLAQVLCEASEQRQDLLRVLRELCFAHIPQQLITPDYQRIVRWLAQREIQNNHNNSATNNENVDSSLMLRTQQQRLQKLLPPLLFGRILGILHLNCFSVFSKGSSSSTEYAGCALFEHGSFLNHSCEPNVAMEPIAPSDAGMHSFVAARDSAAGDELCFSYTDCGAHTDTKTRNAYLWKYYGFVCACPLCSAPPGAVFGN
jgi:hypothetical protein